MAEMDIELESDLIVRVRQLAARHYGDDSDASISRVGEAALEMRLLSLELVKEGGDEIDEPIYHVRQSERTPLWDQFWKNM
jgi:hypothetical protein